MNAVGNPSFFPSARKVTQECEELNNLLGKCGTGSTGSLEIERDFGEDLQEVVDTVVGGVRGILDAFWGIDSPSPGMMPASAISGSRVASISGDGDKIEAFTELRDQLMEIVCELDDHPGNKSLQQKCAQIYMKFLACKIEIIRAKKAELTRDAGPQGNPLIEEIDQVCTKMTDQLFSMERQTEEERVEQQGELTERYLKGRPELVSRLESRTKKVSEVHEITLDWLSYPAYEERLEALERSLSEQQKHYAADVEALRKTVEDEGLTPSEREEKCRRWDERCRSEERAFEQNLADFIALLRQVLDDEVRESQSSDVRGVLQFASVDSNDFLKKLEACSRENVKAIKELNKSVTRGASGSSEEVSLFLSEEMDGGVTIEESETIETWSKSDWGRLLVRGRGNELAGIILSDGFEDEINQLKKAKRASAAESELQLNSHKRRLYHTFLQRIIEVVGEKKRRLKQPGIAPGERQLLTTDVRLLNARFNRMLKKYEALPVPQRPLLEGFQEQVIQTTQNVLSLGYCNSRLDSPGELRNKKYYADLGYDMAAAVGALLNSLMLEDGDTLLGRLQREVIEFTKWADKHPRRAAAMAGDMALTYAALAGQESAEQFISSMRATAYTSAFLEGWGSYAEEPPDIEQELKYRALADLCHYAPLLGAVVRGARESSSLRELLGNITFETVKVLGMQQLGGLLPDEGAAVALQIAQLIKGENYQHILEEQNNIELLRIAGTVKKALADPSDIWDRVKWHARVWWKTLRLAEGEEKAYRVATEVVFPALAVGVSIGIFGFVGVGSITLWVGGGTAVTLLSTAFGTACKTDELISKVYPARHKAIQNLHEERRALMQSRHRDPIQAQSKEFLKNLREKLVLPPQTSRSAPNLDKAQQEECARVGREVLTERLDVMKREWSNEHDSTVSLTELMKFFQKHMELVKRSIEEECINCDVLNGFEEAATSQLHAHLVHTVQNQLIEEWLQEKIEEVISKKIFDNEWMPVSGNEDVSQAQEWLSVQLGDILRKKTSIPGDNWGDVAGSVVQKLFSSQG